MGVYRIELSKTRTAGCKALECKKNGVKIQKGELRYGTLVEIQDHSSWSWKHWGCVTPKQIENLQKTSDNDTDNIDGYEELPDEFKLKVEEALKEGHVADSDWKGDSELNRPGKKGTTKRTPKKATNDSPKNEESPPKRAQKKRRRGKIEDPVKGEEVVKDEDVVRDKDLLKDENTLKAPPPKRAKREVKQVAKQRSSNSVNIKNEDNEQSANEKKPKTRTRRSNKNHDTIVPVKAEEEDSEEPSTPIKAHKRITRNSAKIKKFVDEVNAVGDQKLGLRSHDERGPRKLRFIGFKFICRGVDNLLL
ncbi:MAG: hypothetical protein M1829_003230 [Trizodia sp. TS-e1964]|nr:MAG: hypothetical protein M1829_003230 [Trizodia sp. TS-e1964]